MKKQLVFAMLLVSSSAFAGNRIDYPKELSCLPYELAELKDMSISELELKIKIYKNNSGFANRFAARTNYDNRGTEEAGKCDREVEKMQRVLGNKVAANNAPAQPEVKSDSCKADELMARENDLLKREIVLLKQENETLKAQVNLKGK